MSATRPDGFTLVELVVLCAVVVALSALAVPRYARAMVIYRADNAARVAVHDLHRAATEAEAQAQPVTVTFQTANDRYRISPLSHPDHPDQGFLRDLSAEPYRARISQAVFDGDAQVVFNGFGLPDSGGSVKIQAGDEARTVTLHALTGEAKTQ